MNTNIWKEAQAADACYILYTDDSKYASRLRDLAAYKQGQIRAMGEYYSSVDSNRPMAWQFRVEPDVAKTTPSISVLMK